MKVSSLALKLIQDEYHAGATQEELAKKYHTTQAGIQRILSGKRKLSGIKLGTFEKMFPAATVNLTGDIHQEANGNTNSHINQTAGVIAEDKSEVLRGKIILDLIGLGLAPEILSQVLICVRNSKL